MNAKYLPSCLIRLAFLVTLLRPGYAGTLVETRFGDRDALAPIEDTADGRIQGVLPEGVLEDSAWSGIGVEYRFEEDALGGGLAWIEARLAGGDRGQAQLKWNLPELSEPGRYRLEVLLAGAENAAVTFAIRSTSPPYTAHWEQTLRPGAYRQSHSLDFALPAIEGEVALIAHMGRRGVLYFYDLSLSRRSEADLAAERERLLADAPGNLLSASGFALGLPSAWSTGNHHSRLHDVRVDAAEAVSERGTVPLLFASRREGRPVKLYSAPIEPLLRDEAHTLSFFLRGEVRDGSFAVRVNQRTLASTILPNSPDEWTRVSLTFSPDLTAPWHVLEWSLDGEIELDGLMLEVGPEAGDFMPSAPAEVALGDDQLSNHVLLEGVDEARIAFAVSRARSGDVLQLRVHDIEGREAILPAITLDGSPVQRGTASLEEVFSDRPYGPFRVEGQVLREAETVSLPVERVVYRLRKPRFWGQRAPQSRFGNHISLFEPHLHSSKAIGMNWVRLHGPNGRLVYWSAVEPRPGEWQFHREELQRFLDADMEIVGSWLHVPGWARIERQTSDGWLDNWWQPRDYDEFTEYVRRVTEAHADQISHWQIWNEPWGDFWIGAWRPELGPREQWHPGDQPEEDFARLSRMAYEAGKETLPSVQVLGVNATIGERGKNWMRRMLDLDVEEHSDIITFHAYTGGGLRGILGTQPEGMVHRLNARVFRPLERKLNGRGERPIWLTEGNALPRGPDSGMYVHTLNGKTTDPVVLRENRQALVVYHLQNFAMGTEKIFSYAQNATGAYYQMPSGIYWGALGQPGGELNPQAAAFSTMAWHLEETTFENQSVSEAGVHRFVFTRKDGTGSVAALVAMDPVAEAVALPEEGSLKFEDLFGNPINGQSVRLEQLLWVVTETEAEALHEALDTILP
ncbi:MAG: hypothetical protein JJU29_13950 [Verrucomicrobia bacterium]|nr:hypothetical protein [Verrucomicrobiota bacterium]MCH8510086.1 hypothetical protein [Kiritimatiellia bacterium]